MSDHTADVAAALAAHRYRDVLGDYEIKPYYKHFGCSCGWEQNIAGMSGYWSWLGAHEAHVVAALLASEPIAQALAAVEAVARVEALVEEDTKRRRECREADDCSCSYKDCYECGKWHNCAHTPYTELRDALRPEGDPR